MGLGRILLGAFGSGLAVLGLFLLVGVAGVPGIIGLAAGLGVLLIGFGVGPALERAAAATWIRPSIARLLYRLLRRHPSPARRARAHVVLAYFAARDGDAACAANEIVASLDLCRRSKSCPFVLVNLAVDFLVSAGRYEEALTVQQRWPESAIARGRRDDPQSYWLVRINQAEALHNLGRDDEALAQLRTVLEAGGKRPLVQHGARCLEAWILAQRGDQRALSMVGTVDAAHLRYYEAEVHFTQAAALRARGHLAGAARAARQGLAAARRPSSKRNGWFLLGLIASDSGKNRRALAHFERGLQLPYRGQGGEALLERAHVLARLGRSGEVKAALRLVVARDPESVAARAAAMELDSHTETWLESRRRHRRGRSITARCDSVGS